MKIREGLVSNSSSTSFCIFGTILSEKKKNEFEAKHSDKEYIYEIVDEELIPIIKAKKLNLELHIPPSEYIYIGRSWKNIKDNQTGKEFKEDVEKEIKELLSEENIELDTYEEAWRDG